MQQILASLLPDQTGANTALNAVGNAAHSSQLIEINEKIPVSDFSNILQKLSKISSHPTLDPGNQLLALTDIKLQTFSLDGKDLPQISVSDDTVIIPIPELAAKLNTIIEGLKEGSDEQILLKQVLNNLPEPTLGQPDTEQAVIVPPWLNQLIKTFQPQVEVNHGAAFHNPASGHSQSTVPTSLHPTIPQPVTTTTAEVQDKDNSVQSTPVTPEQNKIQVQNNNILREITLPGTIKHSLNPAETRSIDTSPVTITQSPFTHSVSGQDVPRASTPSLQLHSSLNQPDWSNEIGDRVRWMVNQNIQTAELRLNPPHLGPIEVKVSMSHDQMNILFTAQHGVVREALETAIPRLREMMGDNGLNLADVDVSDQSSSEQKTLMADQNGRHHGSDPSSYAQEEDVAEELILSSEHLRVGLGLIDTYA